MSMVDVLTMAQINRACRVVFGAHMAVTEAFLRSLDGDDLRRRYRQRARGSHPDRAAVLGRHPQVLAAEFAQLTDAYAVLRAFIDGGRRLPGATLSPRPPRRSHPAQASRPPPPPARPAPAAAARPSPERLRRVRLDGLPQRPLRLAEFLHLSGIITWQERIAALAWQRRQRPLIGELAVSWGFLDQSQVREVLRQRRPGEKFAAAALRLGHLNPFQYFAVLGRQRQYKAPIGGYFINAGILSTDQLDAVLAWQCAHETAVRRDHCAV